MFLYSLSYKNYIKELLLLMYEKRKMFKGVLQIYFKLICTWNQLSLFNERNKI